MDIKDGIAISKGNIICLSTGLIFNNLIHMNYRSGCFLSEPVTTKKLHFQLPSVNFLTMLYIMQACFSLYTFSWDPRTQAKFHSFLLPFLHLTHCHASRRMQLVLTRCSREGLSFWGIAVPQTERLTYITVNGAHHAHTFTCKDCDPSSAALKHYWNKIGTFRAQHYLVFWNSSFGLFYSYWISTSPFIHSQFKYFGNAQSFAPY